MSADLIIENANILTCDPQRPRAQALAVFSGRLQKVGSNADVASFQSTETRVIDCRGQTVVPGLNDAHCHFFGGVRKILSLDLSPASVRSIADIQTALRRKTHYLKPGTWINGTDYNEFYLAEKRHPTRQDLDTAAPDHPVILIHRSLHACVLNSLALRQVGIDNQSEEPEGGIIDRDLESGEPNGVLFEMLAWVQKKLKTPITSEELEWGCCELDRLYLSSGITSFTDATVSNDLSQYATFSGLIERGLIHSRVNLMLGIDQLPALQRAGLTPSASPLLLKTGALKIVISQATGQMLPGQSELNQMVLDSNQSGFQVAIHCVETASIEAAVEALEYAQSGLPSFDFRNRLEHCSECPSLLADRIARLKAVVVTQPPFLYYQGERYLEQVTPETQSYLYPFKSLIDAGVRVAGSSDAPVVPNPPLMGLYAAVCRRAQSGQVLLPGQRLTAAQALDLYTSGAAYAGFDENLKGTLAEGLLADMVVLSDDPLTCPPEKIKDIHVNQTIIGGEVVYSR